MVRPVERPEVTARSLLTEKVHQTRQSDPDAKRQFAQQLQAESSKHHEQVEEPTAHDEVLIGGEPESQEGKERESQEERDGDGKTTGEERPEGGIDIRV